MKDKIKPAGMGDSVLAARIEDAVRLCDLRNYPHFVGFLDERQGAMAEQIAKSLKFDRGLLWGGYEGAQRVVFGAFPMRQQPDRDSFPVLPLYTAFRKEDRLSHRDFLGTLMGQGINRETVGDILVEDGRCVLFVRREISEYVTTQLHKVGGAGIRFVEEDASGLPEGRGFEEIGDTIASPRLDCVVAALTHGSREKSDLLIRGRSVALNYEVKQSGSVKVAPEDTLSVKGYGKYIIDQIGPPTKKGRLRLLAKRYK